MPIDPLLLERDRRETHAYLEGDARLLRIDNDRPQALDHRFQMKIECQHVWRFPLQVLGKRVASAGVRLVLIGELSSALGACPQRLVKTLSHPRIPSYFTHSPP